MHRQGVSEPELQVDTQETSPLLTSDDRVHVAKVGGSMVHDAALRRNGQDGENMFFYKTSVHALSECSRR